MKVVAHTMNIARRRLFRALLLVVGLFVGATTATDAAGCEKPVIGRREPVKLSVTANGRAIEQVARVDTGASYSSIDADLARELGIDLEDAETVTITSSLGEERRPLVKVRLRVAGKVTQARVTVTDRSTLSTQVLLGRRDLDGFLIDVTESQLTSPDDPAPGGCAGGLLGPPADPPPPRTLLALMPFVAALVVGLRGLIGIETFGVFAPILLALAFGQMGLGVGLPAFALVLLAGLLVQRLARPLHLPRVARLAVLMAVVSAVMLVANDILADLAPQLPLVAALPVVVLAAIVERFWAIWEQESLAPAVKTAAWTLLVAVATSPFLVTGPVRLLAEQQPLALAVLGAGLSILVGRYRGLRLVELTRFRLAAQQLRAT